MNGYTCTLSANFDAGSEGEAIDMFLEWLTNPGNVIDGTQVVEHDELTYKIVQFYQDLDKPSVVIGTGLTLAEAQEHCSREDTHGDGWFDGYEVES